MGNKIDIISSSSGTKSSGVDHSILKPSIKNSVHHVKVYDSEEAAHKREMKTHYVAPHKKHHNTQHSKTLRRTAVKKPNLRDTGKLIRQSQGALYEKQIETTNLVVSKNELTNRIRENAPKTPKSELVNKFGPFINNKPNIEPTSHAKPAQSVPVVVHHPTITLAAEHKTKNPFENAIERSNSHLERPHQIKRKKRARKLKLIVLVMLVILTAFVSIYHSQLKKDYVSYIANFSVGVPNYTPSGYKLNNNFDFADDHVVLAYSNGIVGYYVVEHKYPLTNEQLQNFYLTEINKQYTTVTLNGKNIYIYSDKNATWVSNNVWYNLVNESGLSNDEIAKIAAST